jgi:membrane-associated phospholipid phosphatase
MTKEFLRSPFIAFCLGMLWILAYPLLFFPKGELVLLINQHHTPYLDLFFKYITYFGDGSIMAILLIGLLFFSYKLSILTTFSVLFQSVLVSLFKRWLFKGLERPTAFFEGIDWNFVEGVNVHGSNTFPSGHTTTGFALFALLVVIFNNRNYILSMSFFLMASLVGLSRVYLLQHFVVDIFFGAIFGILSVVLALMLMEKFFQKEQLDNFHHKTLWTTIMKR